MKYLLMLSLAGCVSNGFKKPIVEECITLASGEFFCLYRDREETRPVDPGYTCLSPLDRQIYEEYLDDKEKRLRKCLQNPRKCQ